MDIERLTWDSAFFNVQVGRMMVTNQNKHQVIDTLAQLKQQGIELVYIFAEEDVSLHDLQLHNLQLVDEKVVFHKQIVSLNECSRDVVAYTGDMVLKLKELAIQSGQFSRFKMDERIPTEKFEELYTLWMSNSLQTDLADKVFVYEQAQEIKGVVTMKKTERQIVIGLIAVDPSYHGKGIGKQLIQAVENEAYRARMDVEVATQLDNRQACHFYSHCGYHIKETKKIYHLWL